MMDMRVIPSSCHCISLLTGCIICATCSIVLYALAVGLELWWIIESEVSLPIPADVLCAVYIVQFITAIFVAVGLAGKKTRILLSCLVIMCLFYFAEGALVLCMIIMHWTLKNKYGIIELVLWIIRAIYNVVAFFTLLSQYATWRDEKQVMMRLQCLSLNGSSAVSSVSLSSSNAMKKEVQRHHHHNHQQQHQYRSDQQFPVNSHGNHQLGTLRTTSNGHVHLSAGNNLDNDDGDDGDDDNNIDGGINDLEQGYDNLAYSTTVSDLTLNGVIKRSGVGVTFARDSAGLIDGGRGSMKRSVSSASQIRLQRSSSLYGGSLPVNGQELNDPLTSGKLQQLNPLALSYGGSIRSEFDASSYSGIFPFPVRSQSELSLNTMIVRSSSSRTRTGGCGNSGGGGGGITKGSTSGRDRSTVLGHKPRSLMYLDEDDYLARPPPSRPVSMNYVNVHQRQADFVTQSLDRPKNSYNKRGSTPRRAASLEAISDVSEIPGVKLQKVAMRPFDYLNRPGSKSSDLNVADVETDVRKIEDVAL